MTRNQGAAVLAALASDESSTRNLPSMHGIFPDYSAPISATGRVDGTNAGALVHAIVTVAQMRAAKKRAGRLEEKGKSTDFKEQLLPDQHLQMVMRGKKRDDASAI